MTGSLYSRKVAFITSASIFTLNMETVWASETSVSYPNNTRCHKTEDIASKSSFYSL